VNPYAFVAIITLSTAVLAGIITFLVSLGISLLMAFIGVYGFAVLFMFGMQHGATRVYDDCELTEQSGILEDQLVSELPPTKPSKPRKPSKTAENQKEGVFDGVA